MKKLRRITEAEVIAEFLKGEFFHKEYDADRERFARILREPNLADPAENELRRILLFRRRDTMWWELPEDRQWWEIAFDPADIDRVSVFPRAHWRRLARGNFNARHVAARVRQLLATPQPDEFVSKIGAIAEADRGNYPGLVIFLGINELHPVTLLEGNHRFVASLLAPDRNLLAGTHTVAVFSPSMEKCCWYKTSFFTLARCLKNRIQHSWDRAPDLDRLLEQAQGPSRGGYSEGAAPVKSGEIKRRFSN
ncbi:MAG TPA: hypothetical protein VKQ89_05115 [Candidatus Angelobacter sp.]|nr:hypothetical protein [Candidatus Angelobacter sp.]